MLQFPGSECVCVCVCMCVRVCVDLIHVFVFILHVPVSSSQLTLSLSLFHTHTHTHTHKWQTECVYPKQAGKKREMSKGQRSEAVMEWWQVCVSSVCVLHSLSLSFSLTHTLTNTHTHTVSGSVSPSRTTVVVNNIFIKLNFQYVILKTKTSKISDHLLLYLMSYITSP